MQDLGLSATIAESLSTMAVGRLARLASWDMSRISRRTRRRMNWSVGHSRVVEREYRRFLGLLMMHPDRQYGMAGEVDELWHDHILDTQDYLAMCRDVVGAVVHHCPGDRRGRGKSKEDSAYDSTTYPDLARSYTGSVSAVWPRQGEDASVARCCGHSLERFAD